MLAVTLLFCAALDLHLAAPTFQKRSPTSSCPDLETPSNGYRKPQESNHSIGAQVSFGCNASYLLQGHEQLTCNYDSETGKASWNGDIPQCIGEGKIDLI